jgi:sulfonate transport system substrate-binding protein
MIVPDCSLGLSSAAARLAAFKLQLFRYRGIRRDLGAMEGRMKQFNLQMGLADRRTFLRSAMGAATVWAIEAPAVVCAQGRLKEMKIFIGSNPSFGSIMIGQQKGFFEKEALPVQVTKFASGATAIEAFRAGRGDVVGAGDLPSLRLWQQGGIGLCPIASYADLSVIVAKKSMTQPVDFRKKRLGVLLGATVEYFAKLYLTSGGVDVKDVEVVNLRPMEMVTGFVRGDIDAFAIFQPFGWMALKADPNAHIVATAAPYFREWLVVNTTPEYAKTHPAELDALVRGLDQTGKWIAANLEEATQLIAKDLRMDDIATVKRMLETIDWSIAYTRKFRADLDRIAEFFQVPVDWKKSFNAEPLARLGASYVES